MRHPAILCDTPHKERAGQLIKQLRGMNASVSVSRVVADIKIIGNIARINQLGVLKLKGKKQILDVYRIIPETG